MTSAAVLKLALVLAVLALIGTCHVEAGGKVKARGKPKVTEGKQVVPHEYDLNANGGCPPKSLGIVKSCCKQNVTKSSPALRDGTSGGGGGVSQLLMLIKCANVLAKKLHEVLNDEDVGDFEFPEVCCKADLFRPMCKKWTETVNADLIKYQITLREQLSMLDQAKSLRSSYDYSSFDDQDDGFESLSAYAETTAEEGGKCMQWKWSAIKSKCCKIRKPATMRLDQRTLIHGKRMAEFWRCVRRLSNQFWDQKRGIPDVCCRVPFFRLLCDDKTKWSSTTTTERPRDTQTTVAMKSTFIPD